MTFIDDSTIANNSPIASYLQVPLPDSVLARANAYNAISRLASGYNYDDRVENNSLSFWFANNLPIMIMLSQGDNMKVAIAYDQKVDGTTGGNTTANVWLQRDFNQKFDLDNIIALLNNNITLLISGKFLIRVSSPMAIATSYHQIRLTVDNVVVAYGTSEYVASTTVQTRSHLTCALSLVSGNVLRIEHRCTATITNGLGLGQSISSSPEIYSIIEIMQYSEV